MLNLTPHAINVNGVTYEPSGTVARVETDETFVCCLDDGTQVISRKPGKVVGLPDYETTILVSSMVLDALDYEWTCRAFAPDTGSTAIRNDKGHIDMVTRLVTK